MGLVRTDHSAQTSYYIGEWFLGRGGRETKWCGKSVTIEVELFRKFYSAVTGPGFIALPAKLRNEFDWPPHLIERDNQTPSRVVAPICSYKAEHVDVGVCCAF